MRQNNAVQSGVFELFPEFDSMYWMDHYLGDQALDDTFDVHVADMPDTNVRVLHNSDSHIYNFSFVTPDWNAMPGEHQKTYTVAISQPKKVIQLNVFSTVARAGFSLDEQSDWTKFQIENGMHVPHALEVDEFLLISQAFLKHFQNSK